MESRARAHLVSAATLVGLALLLVVGVAWAWAAVTDPFPQASETPECTDLKVAPGQELKPKQVVVSVLNASTREGLAGLTIQQLSERGFASGGTANAPDDVVIGTAKIWATDPDSPAVTLLKTYLGDSTRVIRRDSGETGITVVVGNGFAGVVDGQRSIEASVAATVCAPPPKDE